MASIATLPPLLLVIPAMLPFFWHIRILTHASTVQIWVKNWLTSPVYVKVKNREGKFAEPVELVVHTDVPDEPIRLANTVPAYEAESPWFMWLSAQTKDKKTLHLAFVLKDPRYETDRERGYDTYWEICGKGIFYANTDITGNTLIRKQFCGWDESSVLHIQSEPFEYKLHGVTSPCSSYNSLWSWNPVWISISNRLSTDITVTLERMNDTSLIHLHVNKGQISVPSYESAIISPRYEEYRQYTWTMFLRVQQDSSRDFGITLFNPMGSETITDDPTIGCMLKIFNHDVWIVHFNAAGKEKSSRVVCCWKKENATSSVPHCRQKYGFSI